MEIAMSLIYIVEDNRNIREIEVFALKNSGFEVAAFRTGSEMIHQIGKKCPDLIVLDIILPDADGIRLLGKIRSRTDTKKIPVMFVSARSSELDVVRGLDAGADDYLVKPFGVMELISRVKALLRRTSVQDDTEADEWMLLPDGQTLKISEKSVSLTHKEYELVQLLLKNRGNVVSRDKLMETIWGIDYLGESRTLDMHIRALRKKLGTEGKRITTVRGVGYRLEEASVDRKKTEEGQL